MTEPKIKMPKKSVVERRQQVLEVLISLLNSEEGMQRITTERLAAAVGCRRGRCIAISQVKPRCLKR
ncbi:division inhibitor protein [Mannheimia haemolytica]|uniref:Division inhibitor protein n=1 Tax=Mannheimia haemolytica TaxID=75985 RepID=A0A378N2C2_MANHA|nr:division inhibitor protein [Mannheimia haemolytica]